MFTGYGRVRSVAAAPDGTLWLGTSNQDANGTPGATDDRIISTDGYSNHSIECCWTARGGPAYCTGVRGAPA